MTFDQIEAIQTGKSKIARTKQSVGADGSTYGITFCKRRIQQDFLVVQHQMLRGIRFCPLTFCFRHA